MSTAAVLILLLVALAFASSLLATRTLTGRKRRLWPKVIAAWVIVSTVAFLSLAWYYSGQSPEESLNAWQKDGVFKTLAFIFWNSSFVLTVNLLVVGATRLRGRSKSRPHAPSRESC